MEPKRVSPALAIDPPANSRENSRSTTKHRALADVYRAHHRFVWRSAVRLGVSEDRAGDAVHDVFMVVARRLAEFEERANIRTWLFAITMRVSQSMRRDEARETRRRSSFGAVADQNGERPHARADAATMLRDLLRQIDEDKRAVFIMSELEGMTAPEIASALRIKIPTVYSRLRLARGQLERLVKRHRARERREP